MSLRLDEMKVLSHLSAGRSAWHGWENGHPARTDEAREAYMDRARAITSLRRMGLVDDHSQLTEQGRQTAAHLPKAAGGRP